MDRNVDGQDETLPQRYFVFNGTLGPFIMVLQAQVWIETWTAKMKRCLNGISSLMAHLALSQWFSKLKFCFVAFDRSSLGPDASNRILAQPTLPTSHVSTILLSPLSCR